jgi:hypothetical protein
MWPGIRTRMRFASNYPCLRREANPGGRTGYPENYWDSLFVSPKCGKRVVRLVHQNPLRDNIMKVVYFLVQEL